MKIRLILEMWLSVLYVSGTFIKNDHEKNWRYSDNSRLTYEGTLN